MTQQECRQMCTFDSRLEGCKRVKESTVAGKLFHTFTITSHNRQRATLSALAGGSASLVSTSLASLWVTLVMSCMVMPVTTHGG